MIFPHLAAFLFSPHERLYATVQSEAERLQQQKLNDLLNSNNKSYFNSWHNQYKIDMGREPWTDSSKSSTVKVFMIIMTPNKQKKGEKTLNVYVVGVVHNHFIYIIISLCWYDS